MRICALPALKKHLEALFAAALIVVGIGIAASPAGAVRGIVIDNNTDEIWSDADDAQSIPLSFPVNYGDGLQTHVTVHLPTSFSSSGFAAVGLSITGSPADALFATVAGSNIGVPGLRLSNETELSTPASPVDDASIFDFGTVTNADMAPPPPGTPSCEMRGISRLCYGPMTDAAIFHFIDMSASGATGDFELVLTCGVNCGNIGFNLAGLNFSADDFDAGAAQPPQFVSYAPVQSNLQGTHGTWTFLFRNVSGVPEPSTWASMLLGFALIGASMRRQRRRELLLN